MNFPVADAFKPGKPLLRGLDRPFGRARRSNDDRALAAAEKFFVSGYFIDKRHAIARHLSPSHPAMNNLIACRYGAPMIWINFGTRGRQDLTRTRSVAVQHPGGERRDE